MSVNSIGVQDLKDDKTVALFLYVYIVYILVCALTPFTFSADSSSLLLDLFADKFDTKSRLWSIPTWDLVSNVFLFIPFGFLLVTVSVVSRYLFTTKLLLTGAVTLLLSFSVETAQLFLPRAPSVVDVLTNTIGGMVGALLGIYVRVPFCYLIKHSLLRIERSLWLVTLFAVYVVTIVVAAALPLPIGPILNNWDPDYPLQLGNEVTFDRPWLGKIFLLAIYDRALPSEEVLANFLEGSLSDSRLHRSNKGVVAFYDFREGTGTIVHDRSGLDHPIDLQIQNPQHVKWLRPNGLEIFQRTRIQSRRVPSNLYTSKMLSDSELTVEVWIASSNLTQHGPARIVTLSRDTELRNFTLGQTGQDVEFRLRTAVSGLNGMRPKLRTTDRPLTTEMQHLVITYHLGEETLYVNGKKHLDIVLDRSLFAFQILDETVGRKYRWAYWFLIIFPVGFVTSMFLSLKWGHRWITFVTSTLCTIGLICVVEWLQVATGQRAHDVFFIPVGSGIALLSIVIGYNILREVEQFNLRGISTATPVG